MLLHEPPWARAGELRAQLLDESYAKPFVIDDGKSRFLYFNVRLMQSEMSLKAPNDLAIRYAENDGPSALPTRPKRIALIGLGGGSLVKFCYHRMPGTHMTAIELDPEVIAFRDTFPAAAGQRAPAGHQRRWRRISFETLKKASMCCWSMPSTDRFRPGLANRQF